MQKIKNFLFTSFWLFPVFLIIPVFTVLNLKLRLPVSGDLLLVNNGVFAFMMLVRFLWYLKGLTSQLRYGADRSVPKGSQTVESSTAELKDRLSRAGYRFDSAGRYGEKRDLGYLGTTVLYGALALLLAVGSYDYMREYAIMVRLGVGLPVALDGKGLVGDFEAGNLANPRSLPQLQILKQILPNEKYPKGGTEIALVTKDGKELAKTTLTPGKPFNYGGLDYHMTKFIFDGLLMVRQGKFIIFDEFIKFLPLPEKKGVYSYYSPRISKESKLTGEAWLNPEKKAMRVVGKMAGKQVMDVELELWGVNKKEVGDYLATFDGLAHWSEIRVARERHRHTLAFGAILALLGLGLRLAVRPRRVWLEEKGSSTLVRLTGGETQELIGKRS